MSLLFLPGLIIVHNMIEEILCFRSHRKEFILSSRDQGLSQFCSNDFASRTHVPQTTLDNFMSLYLIFYHTVVDWHLSS